MPNCPHHGPYQCPECHPEQAGAALGRRTSPAKAAASKANGKLGGYPKGRPRTPKDSKKLGREEFCPKCEKLVYTVRGRVPRCPKCKSETQAVC